MITHTASDVPTRHVDCIDLQTAEARTMARIRAVLFDIDGTLLESNEAHAHAWVEALRGHGHEVPYDTVRSKIGMGSDKLLADVARIDRESELGQAITSVRGEILKAQYLADLGPFHGARMLVDMLQSRGLLCIAISAATSDHTADLLEAAGVADLMDDIVCSPSKPGHDLVRIALDRLGVEADEAVMLGDTPYDIEAANRAGVGTIALRCGGYWNDEALHGALAIFDDPADLAARLDHSPLALDRESMPPPSPMKVRTRRVTERQAS
jgi:phosphoglycolate phosphatase-like HAD superfamily hydrolase